MTTQRTILLLFVLLAALWCAGFFLAPVLRSFAIAGSGDLYAFYGLVCHQLDGRSWHLSGEPLAVCVRCTSIYLSFTLSLTVLFAMPSRWQRLPSPRPLLIAAGLLALDAVLQLGGVWTNTLLSRTMTGALVGGYLPWYLVPLLLEAVAGLRRGQSSDPADPEGDHLHV